MFDEGLRIVAPSKAMASAMDAARYRLHVRDTAGLVFHRLARRNALIATPAPREIAQSPRYGRLLINVACLIAIVLAAGGVLLGLMAVLHGLGV